MYTSLYIPLKSKEKYLLICQKSRQLLTDVSDSTNNAVLKLQAAPIISPVQLSPAGLQNIFSSQVHNNDCQVISLS